MASAAGHVDANEGHAEGFKEDTWQEEGVEEEDEEEEEDSPLMCVHHAEGDKVYGVCVVLAETGSVYSDTAARSSTLLTSPTTSNSSHPAFSCPKSKRNTPGPVTRAPAVPDAMRSSLSVPTSVFWDASILTGFRWCTWRTVSSVPALQRQRWRGSGESDCSGLAVQFTP